MDESEQQVTSAPCSSNEPPRRSIFKTLTIVLGVCVALETIVLVVLGVLFGGKWLTLISKVRTSHSAEVYNVCDDKLIDHWNWVHDPDGNKSPIVWDVANIAKEASRRPNYEKDPTCQYFIFQSALYNNDADTMQRSFDAINKLSQRGIAINSRVAYRLSLDEMKSALTRVKK